jgi:histone deacetylase 11
MKAFCCRNSINKTNHRCCNIHQDNLMSQVLPIVYNQRYNVTFCGLEKIHPFDSQKYGRVYQALIQKGVIDPKIDKLHSPVLPSKEFLNELQEKKYQFLLNYSVYICMCLEVPLFFLPEFLLRIRVLEPMQLAT